MVRSCGRGGVGDDRVPCGAHVARENEFGPQVDEQDAVDVGEVVVLVAFSDDDLVDTGALSAITQVECAT